MAGRNGHGRHTRDAADQDVDSGAPEWTPNRPGQHYDVRLPLPDGYQAERSYSAASPPERVGELDLTVERIADGEVSPYLHDVLMLGDQLEVRGPIARYFVWEVALGGPSVLIGAVRGLCR